MDPWRTNKRVLHETGRRSKERNAKQEGDEKGMQGITGGPTIGGIKSAKERWLAARGAESDEVERNRGAKEADTIHNGLGEPARRSNAIPTGITDVHNWRETTSLRR